MSPMLHWAPPATICREFCTAWKLPYFSPSILLPLKTSKWKKVKFTYFYFTYIYYLFILLIYIKSTESDIHDILANHISGFYVENAIKIQSNIHSLLSPRCGVSSICDGICFTNLFQRKNYQEKVLEKICGDKCGNKLFHWLISFACLGTRY